MQDIQGLICYWEYEEQNYEQWKLVQSYLVDGDGYGASKGAPEGRNAHEVWAHGMDEDGNTECMGRSVTFWSIEHGVSLLEFSPPEPVKWLSLNFYHDICKKSDWMSYLNCGHTLWFGTMAEASKYIKISNLMSK